MFDNGKRNDAQARGWLIPVLLAGLGAWGWACQDTSDGAGGSDSESASGTTAGDETGDDSANGPGSSPSGSGEETGIPPEDVDRQDVLWSIAHEVIVPATADFAGVAAQLSTATDALATATQADPAAAQAELTEAQDAWRQATVTWQELEMMQVGPAAPSVSAPGGENLRDEIYSWPTVDTCTIDRAIADGGYTAQDFFLTELVYAYGLDALEYLLFVHDMNHTCGAQVQLDGPWAALGFEEVERRRAEYAAIVAAEIARQADVLAARWSPEAEDFAAALANPGAEGSAYGSEMEALDEVFRAMFYIDLRTKDAKLGRALGLVEGCAAAPCPNLMESSIPGGQAAPAIASNLRALKHMVQGGPTGASAGFDDLLVGSGNGDIAETLLADIDAAIAAAEAFEEPLQQVIVADATQVENLHTAIKKITDTLKGPFVMALMLTVPQEGAGDND